MNRFSKAVRAGINSANEATANVAEIHAALSELSQAVREVSEGLVEVVRGRVPAGGTNPFTAALGVLGGVKMLDSISLQRTINPRTSIELARLDISSSGYPCDVMFGSKKLTCYDKDSFVKILEDLLASPDAGKALLRLIDMKPQPDTPEE